MDKYDLVVIGGGPGGYVAAIRASQLGMKVALIEKRKTLGGTCLNIGCIPSKALLDSSELYHQAHKHLGTHGFSLSNLEIDVKKMMARKTAVVESTVRGVAYLMKKNKIALYNGAGRLVSANRVEIAGDAHKLITGDKILLATGSESTPLPSVPIDKKKILSSTEALALEKIPEHLSVIGGGAIGVELGSVYARLGSKVTLLEFASQLLPTIDHGLGKALEGSLAKMGMMFSFDTNVTASHIKGNKVLLKAQKDKKEIEVESDYVLVSIGRRPYTQGLGLEKVGVERDSKGRIKVNEDFQTNVESVYALGDLISGPMLAHKASEEGVVCVERMVGEKPELNHLLIPSVVYTWPEVASVGYSEEQLKERAVAYKKGEFPFKASGRARAAEELDGFIKVLAHKETDEILGVHMIGARCADMIAQAVTAMAYRASAEDIGMLVCAHPTFSESFKEAALKATGERAIHL